MDSVFYHPPLSFANLDLQVERKLTKPASEIEKMFRVMPVITEVAVSAKPLVNEAATKSIKLTEFAALSISLMQRRIK